jgi:hypothetical protein
MRYLFLLLYTFIEAPEKYIIIWLLQDQNLIFHNLFHS